MREKRFILFWIILWLILSSQLNAQTLKLPYQDIGACPFECCTYREWVGNKETIIHKQMRDGSPVAFKIKKGEKVRGVTGVVITTVAGKVKVLKSQTLENSKVKVKKGETLLILTYLGEGYFRFWYKGKFFEENADLDGIKVVSQPKSVWWVKIKNRKGQIGWTRLSENFDNQDACG